jgi:hypothetical protein
VCDPKDSLVEEHSYLRKFVSFGLRARRDAIYHALQRRWATAKPKVMNELEIVVGPFRFVGRLEVELAPETCKVFRKLLPYKQKMIHARWSGEGCWIPLGSENFSIPYENHTSHPAPGQFLFYPGGFGETEILLAYGGVTFASKMGQLAGNHFLTLTQGMEKLPELGRKALWEGAQDVVFSPLNPGI